jgi:hypothetical protein
MLFVFLFFWFIFKTERTAMKGCCLLDLLNENTFQSVELMDSKIQTTKDIIKKKED